MWIICDEFGDSTIGRYLVRQPNQDCYIMENFEVRTWAGNYKMGRTQTVLTRMRNALVHAYNTQLKLPKWIIVIFEDDIIKRYNFKDAESGYYRLLKWLMNEFNKVTETFRDQLPIKAKKHGWPHFMWLEATRHSSDTKEGRQLRRSFTNAQLAIQKIFDNVVTLHFKQVWDENEAAYYNERDQGRMSDSGLRAYWRAVDKTVKFGDAKLTRAGRDKKMKDIFYTQELNRQNAWSGNDRYHFKKNLPWQDNNRSEARNQHQYKLPKPPN